VIVEVDLAGVEVPRIVDFGIAVLCGHGDRSVAGRRITGTGFVLGTPAYMAPEQAQGDAPDPRADLFALGVMTYEMLAGVQPFGGDGAEVIMSNLSKDPPPIHWRAPGVAVDPLLEAFTRRLMARNLRQRFASARAALDLLALIERDRAAAAAELGIVTEMDLVETAPARRPGAMAPLPRPAWMPPVLPGRPPAAALPPALQTSKVPPGFPVRRVPPVPPAPSTAPARSTPRLFGLAGSGAWLGCFAFLAGGVLAFALVAG
jgi:serine/threonine-protein kinase